MSIWYVMNSETEEIRKFEFRGDADKYFSSLYEAELWRGHPIHDDFAKLISKSVDSPNLDENL